MFLIKAFSFFDCPAASTSVNPTLAKGERGKGGERGEGRYRKEKRKRKIGVEGLQGGREGVKEKREKLGGVAELRDNKRREEKGR